MLYFKPVAASMGYSRFPENVGSMVNRGVELDLYSNIIENKNFSWNVNFNLTHFKNKVLELSPELNGQLIDGARIYREDESMYQLYLPKYVGVDSETGESLWALVTPDENGNTVTKSYSVASENRFASGDILPKFMVVLEQVSQPMALISLFRLHISLVDVFWTILTKD